MTDNMNKFRGKHIRLAGLMQEDTRTILEWFNDSRFMEHWDTNPVVYRTQEAVSDWIDELDGDSEQVVFGVRNLQNNALVGLAILGSIEWPNKIAEVSIGIGRPSHWDKGWGSEALRLLIDYAFSTLNLHKLQLSVMSNNQRAIAIYEELGFQHEGSLREYVERQGTRHNLELFGLIHHEWAPATNKAEQAHIYL